MEKDKPANVRKGDRKRPFRAKSRNGSTPISISQRMTLCALPKTEPAGDAIHSTAILGLFRRPMMMMMMMMMHEQRQYCSFYQQIHWELSNVSQS